VTLAFDFVTPEDDRFMPWPGGPHVPIRIKIRMSRFCLASAQHTRGIDIAILSVCLSVCHAPVLYRNGLTYHTLLSISF